MFEDPILQKGLVALLIGLLLGTQREKAQLERKEQDFAGIRSFAILTVLGYICAYLNNLILNNIVIVGLISIMIITTASYIYDAFKNNKKGITAELSAFSAFILGVLTFYNMEFAVISAIVITGMLSVKHYLHAFVSKLNKEEYFATLKFALIAFVILPILPDFALDAWGVVNLYNIWLMVVFVSAISFIGYILTKALGATTGIGLTGLVGGLVSSTAVTTSMSNQSKNNNKIVFPFVLAVLAASSMMLIRVIFVAGVLNFQLAIKLSISLGLMILINIGISVFLWYKTRKKAVKYKEILLSSPFQFMPALKFGVFFLFILFLIELAQRSNLGSSGFYLTALIAGFADVDAINISMAQKSLTNPNLEQLAAQTVTLAVISNTIVKGGIAYLFGGKQYAKYILISISSVIIAGIIGILLI